MRGIKPKLIVDNSAVSAAPPAPRWLSQEACAEWRRVTPILAERRILTTADLGNLENYCVAIGQVRECERLIQLNGLVLDTDNGPKRNPAFGMQSDAMTRARLLAAELGLTPVSRSRPSVRGDGSGDDLSFLG